MMIPRPYILLSILATVLGLTSVAQAQSESYLLKPYSQTPGEVVVTRVASDTTGGTISVISGEYSQKGTSSTKRNRVFERRIIGNGPTAKIEYIDLIDQIFRKSSLGTKQDNSVNTGPLVGQVIYGLKDDIGRWRLFLKGKTATAQQAAALVGLEAYENRQLFRRTPVKVGETWAFEPSFIRNLIERDMGPVVLDATMTLTSIQVIDGEQCAVLNMTIKTNAQKGGDESARVARAILDLKGTLYVSLDTMLDKKLTLSGSLTTSISKYNMFTMVQSPVQYVVEKSVKK